MGTLSSFLFPEICGKEMRETTYKSISDVNSDKAY